MNTLSSLLEFIGYFEPVGSIKMYGGSTAPTHWLFCDGSAVSRTTYSALFNAIGTTFGTGDGSTTFNLPDFRGRTAIGAGTGTASDATAHTLGSTGGAEKHKLEISEMPSHTHSGATLGWSPANGGTGNAFRAVIDGNTNATGGNGKHNNMQPYTTINYIIFAGV